MTDITLPEDPTKSRLHKPPRGESDDIARVGDRIAAFVKKFPEGRIITSIETIREVGDHTVYTMRAAVFRTTSLDYDEEPHATAYATRGTNDPDEITALFPQETAETSAVSRALRNLGILAKPRGKAS